MELVPMKKPLPCRKKLPHVRPSWAVEDAVYFLTVCCEPRGVNHLCRLDMASVLAETVLFRHERQDWWLHLFLAMPDHVHALISFPVHVQMKNMVSAWKQSVARRTGIRWQRDFFDHRLRHDESYVEKAHYIRMNPVRRGLSATPEAWPYVWSAG